MAEYIVVSPRVGTPGEPWEPDIYVNVHALLEGGFIRQATDADPTPAPAKASRVKPKTKPDTEPTE